MNHNFSTKEPCWAASAKCYFSSVATSQRHRKTASKTVKFPCFRQDARPAPLGKLVADQNEHS